MSTSILTLGVAGDGIVDDSDALIAAFSGPVADIYLDGGHTYRITKMVRVTGWNKRICGPRSATIRMDAVASAGVQPALLLDANSKGSIISGFTVDHRGQDWPLGTPFAPGVFASLTADARGIAVLSMGDNTRLDDLFVENGWDNCISLGRFDEVTGLQVAGPEGARVSGCSTFNAGCGKHTWGPAPGGQYFQGAGVDILTATNFIVSNCQDWGSYDGFWADISGGAYGQFVNCVSHFCGVGPIWSDAAIGGNQSWNLNGFGGNLTGAGAGWLKTPGGIAFYSGTYGVQFANCQAISPAMYGMALDFYAAKNNVANFQCFNSGMNGIVAVGAGHQFSNITLEGCGQNGGSTAPSGSVCPPISAFMATGAAGVDADVAISGLNVSPGRWYPGQPVPPVKHAYAIEARGRNGRTAAVKVRGATLAAGLSGTTRADAGCSVNIT